jgi:hypothetical protein
MIIIDDEEEEEKEKVRILGNEGKPRERCKLRIMVEWRRKKKTWK